MRRRATARRRWSPSSRRRRPSTSLPRRGSRALARRAQRRAAAWYTIVRAASISIAMSAIMNCRPWNSAEPLAELLALLDICDRHVERTLGDADRLRTDRRAGVVQRRQRRPEPGAGLADDPDRPGSGSSRSGSPVVGEPLMPSLRSLVPTMNPGSSACTTNAEIPLAPLSGSVTAITVYQLDTPGIGDPALGAVQHPVVPVGDRPGAHRRRVAAGLPLGQRIRVIASPDAIDGSTSCFSSSDPDRMIGIDPSLFTAGISDDDAQTRATSSITMHRGHRVGARAVVLVGDVHRLETGCGECLLRLDRECARCSSTSAACGAISFSHSSRNTVRNSLCSSGSSNKSKSGLPVQPTMKKTPLTGELKYVGRLRRSHTRRGCFMAA